MTAIGWASHPACRRSPFSIPAERREQHEFLFLHVIVQVLRQFTDGILDASQERCP
jgi:hypothetical protein